MSTESPVIRNFRGLEKLEEVVSRFQLIVNQGYGVQTALEKNDVMPVPPGDIRDVGIVLRSNSGTAELLEAVGQAGLLAEDVSLYVIAEGRFLKNRDVLHHVPLLQLGESFPIVQWKSTRPDSMNDRKHGCDLHLVVALNKNIEHVPLRPRRFGTILAKADFTIKPTKLGDGFIPLPLTDEVRGDRLPKATVLWVETLGDLFEAESLDEAIAIYIDEDLHSDIGSLRTPEAKLTQLHLAVEALCQIVYLASAELAGREITEIEEQSVIGQYLFAQLQKIPGSGIKQARDALLRVKNEPSMVAAQFTAQGRYKNQLKRLLRGDGDSQ